MHLLGNWDDCLEIVVTSDVFCLSSLWMMSLSYTNTNLGEITKDWEGIDDKPRSEGKLSFSISR